MSSPPNLSSSSSSASNASKHPTGLHSPPPTLPTMTQREQTTTTETNPRKRSSPSSPQSSDDMVLRHKKQRTASAEVRQHPTPAESQSRAPLSPPHAPVTSPPSSAPPPGKERTCPNFADLYPRLDTPARTGLQQCIALALRHVGFDASTPEALEQFTLQTEEYISHLGGSINHAATIARRSVPAAVDYEFAIPQHNLSPWQLKKHLKPPARLPEVPVPDSVFAETFPQTALPDLHVFEILSGEPDRSSKNYIPAHFPAFPSVHTYRSTPVETSMAASILRGEEQPDEAAELVETRRKRREQAAIEAKQGEEALRRVVRAAKIRRQKEATLAVVTGRDVGAKNRHRAWENSMSEFASLARKAADSVSGGVKRKLTAVEMADHSMVVNSERDFHREVLNSTNGNGNGNGSHGSSSFSSGAGGSHNHGGVGIMRGAVGDVGGATSIAKAAAAKTAQG